MPNTYTELRRTVVGTATSSVTLDLTGISGYTDLVLVAVGNASANGYTKLYFNNVTTSTYSMTNLFGTGSSAGSSRQTTGAGLGYIQCHYLYTGSSQAPLKINLMNYSNTTTNKTVLIREDDATYEVTAKVGLWQSTNAITSISLDRVSGNWTVGSTFSLYGIANADQGAAKATGGIITEDANYWYHTFGASGAFIPKQSLTCDVLVVAGGGSGGGQYAGGGGAGGVAYDGARSLSATSYNVTIGGGGTAISSSAANGNTGTNSSFDTLVANGGGGGGAWGIGGVAVGANGLTGGSGGGGSMGTSAGNTTSGGTATQGASTGDIGYGSNGGGGIRTSTVFYGGGGGGAGAVGQTATGSTVANGGAGIDTYSSWLIPTGIGVNGFIAGGGGGGNGTTATPVPLGGAGGGGNGGIWDGGQTNARGFNGVTNTGSGGGAASSNALAISGAGGSGVVIVRYAK